MSATTNGSAGPGTIDAALSMDGNILNLASQGQFIDPEVTVQLNPPIGVTGIVIGNQVLIGLTFIRVPGSGIVGVSGPQSQIQHRWLYGTISGNTITGEFSDIVQPTGAGTFMLNRVTQAAQSVQSRRAAVSTKKR